MGNVHICARRKVHPTSVFEDFRVLVLCCQFQLFLPLHVTVSSQHTQVASIHCQQHHRARENPIPDVSEALSRHHDVGTKNEPGKGSQTRFSSQVL